jgi:hypothetical protein
MNLPTSSPGHPLGAPSPAEQGRGEFTQEKGLGQVRLSVSASDSCSRVNSSLPCSAGEGAPRGCPGEEVQEAIP